MTHTQLRRATVLATKKDQQALLIWANRGMWETCRKQISPGTRLYAYAMDKINSGTEAYISGDYKGFTMLGAIAVSVAKLNASDAFFRSFLKSCQDYKGPITLLPANQIVK